MPKPRSGESRTEYIKRCIPIVINEGASQDEAVAKCYGMWKQNLADRNKVSFDYDGVLETPKGKSLAKRLIFSGKSVYIITARNERFSGPVEQAAKEVGIPMTKVIFTGSNSSKVDAVRRLNISVHYDDNPDVVKDINENTGAQGVKF